MSVSDKILLSKTREEKKTIGPGVYIIAC